MVLFNHSTRELTAKIVYYGPGLCGKTTNLRVLHERLEKGTAGRLLSLATAQDRTIYFDLLPVELGNIKGYTVRFQLCTVPGQVFYNETRKLVLRGVDGVVFVVDSQWSMVSHNLESWQNLVENLRDLSVGIEGLPVVIQYNKRDLPGVLTVDALQESLGFPSYPFVEAIASSGHGVVETFKLVTKLTFVDLLRRLQRSGGIESEVFSVPSGAVGATADPLDETQARPGRAQKRSSFADHAASAPPPEPAAAVADREQPFGDAPGWMPEAESDVFAIPPPAYAAEPEPFAAPVQASAPAPESIATVADILDVPDAEAVASAAGPAAASAAEPQEREPESAMTVSLSAPDPSLREAVSRQEEGLAEVRGELAALREEMQSARTQLGTSVEALASSLSERLSSLGADLFASRGDAERTRGELAETHRALVERVEKVEKVESLAASVPLLEEKLLAGLRASDEAREALARRLSEAEQELLRSRAVVEEAHRHIDERLGAAERRTKSLADSIRKALDELKD